MFRRFVKRHFITLLSFALHVANAKPAAPIRERFYEIKDRLLHRFGEADGLDYQKINKKCWDCNDGVNDWDGGSCERCDGTGNYSTTYVKLERRRLGRRIVIAHEFEVLKPNILGFTRSDNYILRL